jgi:hypothetical protein
MLMPGAGNSAIALALDFLAYNFELKLNFISYANQAMESGSRLHLEVVATNTELADSSHCISGQRHLCRDFDSARHPV